MGVYTEEFDGYFLWLCDLINADMNRYSELCFALHSIDFVWVLELDEDRAEDGLSLRRKYYEQDISEDWIMFLDKPCSVFEALIGIARRMNYILEDEDSNDMSFMYFWEFIKNLGLKKYSNVRLKGRPKELIELDLIDIQTICDDWMNRNFGPDGSGTPFPLEFPFSDQRLQTINSSMNAYVFERYFA
jgi:hypothetical protein